MTDRKKKIAVGKVIKLSKEQNESLSTTPFRVANEVFKELDCWRNRSLKSDIMIN